MNAAISDTDILSTFGKIGRVDLLQRLFNEIYVAPAVYHELLRVEQLGGHSYSCSQARKFVSCLVFLTSTLRKSFGPSRFKRITSTEDLAEVIDQIEEKDHTHIKAKKQILRD